MNSHMIGHVTDHVTFNSNYEYMPNRTVAPLADKNSSYKLPQLGEELHKALCGIVQGSQHQEL